MRGVALHDHRDGLGGDRSPISQLIHRNLSPRERARFRKEQAQQATRSIVMLDIVMLAMGLGFFVLAVGYTYACERL
jgi:hypothetical protein